MDEQIERIRDTMVFNPQQLHRYLRNVFGPEEDFSVCNVYHAYMWLAFSGFRSTEAVSLTANALDFSDMVIRYGDKEGIMYRESVPAFRNCLMDTFTVYGTGIRQRAPGDKILRGFFWPNRTNEEQTEIDVLTFRKNLNSFYLSAEEKDPSVRRKTYNNIWLSGIFYRTFQFEALEGYVSFAAIAYDYAEFRKKSKTVGEKPPSRTIRKTVTEMENEYTLWKKAFLPK